MKRIQMILTVLVMALVLVGCQGGNTLTQPPDVQEPPASEVLSAPAEQEAPDAEEHTDADKEALYQDILTRFENGETCNVYSDLEQLGDYKNSARLKDEVYVQNQLGFITLGGAKYFRENREHFALLPNHLIDEVFAEKQWIVPNFRSHSYLEYHLAADHTGEVIDPFLGESFGRITWNVTENGFRIGNPDVITDQDEINYTTEIRKAAEGVYIFYVLDAPQPHGGSDIVCYIDKASDFGKRYMKSSAIINGIVQDETAKWHIDQSPYGLYFIVKEGQ